MKTQKIDNTSFGTFYTIKTKRPAILNALDDMAFEVFEKRKKPVCRYVQIATSEPGLDGYFRGLLDDFIDVTKEKTVFVEKVEDLSQIPVLRRYMSKISKKVKEITQR